MKKIECEVYSRIVGYYRPIKQSNEGKREEIRERNLISTKDIKIEEKFKKS